MSQHPYTVHPLIEGIEISGAEGRVCTIRNEFDEVVCRIKPPQPLPAAKIPLVRGAAAFWVLIARRMSELKESAERAALFEDEELSLWHVAGSLVGSLMIALFLFIALPLAISLAGHSLLPALPWTVITALLRSGLFILFLRGLRRFSDIRRLWAWHAAAHQTINAWENRRPSTAESLAQESMIDPCCPSSFLLSSAVVGIFVTALISSGSLWYDILFRMFSFIAVTALLYELFRIPQQREPDKLVSLLLLPGLWLQKLTLFPPQPRMYEVSVAAVNNVPHSGRHHTMTSPLGKKKPVASNSRPVGAAPVQPVSVSTYVDPEGVFSPLQNPPRPARSANEQTNRRRSLSTTIEMARRTLHPDRSDDDTEFGVALVEPQVSPAPDLGLPAAVSAPPPAAAQIVGRIVYTPNRDGNIPAADDKLSSADAAAVAVAAVANTIAEDLQQEPTMVVTRDGQQYRSVPAARSASIKRSTEPTSEATAARPEGISPAVGKKTEQQLRPARRQKAAANEQSLPHRIALFCTDVLWPSVKKYSRRCADFFTGADVAALTAARLAAAPTEKTSVSSAVSRPEADPALKAAAAWLKKNFFSLYDRISQAVQRFTDRPAAKQLPSGKQGQRDPQGQSASAKPHSRRSGADSAERKRRQSASWKHTAEFLLWILDTVVYFFRLIWYYICVGWEWLAECLHLHRGSR